MRPNTFQPIILSIALGLAMLLVPSQNLLASTNLLPFSQQKKTVIASNKKNIAKGKNCNKKNYRIARIDISSENIHFKVRVYRNKEIFLVPKLSTQTLNKYLSEGRIWQWSKTYIIGRKNNILDSLKVGDIVGDIDAGFYKNKNLSSAKPSFTVLYCIDPGPNKHINIPYHYQERDNKLFAKGISDFLKVNSDIVFLYSINQDYLIWIEKPTVSERREGELCHIQIYQQLTPNDDRNLKTVFNVN